MYSTVDKVIDERKIEKSQNNEVQRENREGRKSHDIFIFYLRILLSIFNQYKVHA
jgi:hypothetical protein